MVDGRIYLFDILNVLQFIVLDLLVATVCWMLKLAMHLLIKGCVSLSLTALGSVICL